MKNRGATTDCINLFLPRGEFQKSDKFTQKKNKFKANKPLCEITFTQITHENAQQNLFDQGMKKHFY